MDKALIFEDDVRFQANFKRRILRLMEEVEQEELDWDIMYDLPSLLFPSGVQMHLMSVCRRCCWRLSCTVAQTTKRLSSIGINHCWIPRGTVPWCSGVNLNYSETKVVKHFFTTPHTHGDPEASTCIQMYCNVWEFHGKLLKLVQFKGRLHEKSHCFNLLNMLSWCF